MNRRVLVPRRPGPARLRRAGSRLATAVAGAAVLIGLVAPVATAAAATEDATDDPTVGVAAAPAQHGQPDGRSRFSLIVSAGQQVSDALLVRNTGSTDQTFDLYATDAYTTSDGAFALLDEGSAPRGAGTWVALQGGSGTTTLSLAAGDQALVPFVVTVPADATPGDHAGGIVVSVSSPVGEVSVDRRLATRLYVRVKGTVTPTLVVRSVSAAQPVGGNPFTAPTTITAVVANTGDVALTARAEASVHTWFGLPVGSSVSDEVAELLPGATRTLTFPLGSVGRVGYLTPSLRLTPTADAEAYAFTLPAVDGRGMVPAIPWLLLTVVVVVAAGLRVLLVARRRRAGAVPGTGAAKARATAGERR